MRQVYLLATKDLEQFLQTEAKKKEPNVRLYYSGTDMVPVQVVAELKDMNVELVKTSTPEEVIFDIGLFIGQQKCYGNGESVELYCGSHIRMPDSLMQSLNIRKMDGTAAEPKTKASRKKTASAKEPKRAKQEPKANDSAGQEKESVQEELVKESAGPLSNGYAIEAETESGSVDTANTAHKDMPKENPESAAKASLQEIFLKQMTVRGNDLKDAEYTDGGLVYKLVQIFKDDKSTSRESLRQMLLDEFSPDDTEIIYHWVKPNAKRLHELAVEIEAESL